MEPCYGFVMGYFVPNYKVQELLPVESFYVVIWY